MADWFLRLLQECEAVGLLKLRHVAAAGTKIEANASNHQAISYDRAATRAMEPAAETVRLLERARRTLRWCRN